MHFFLRYNNNKLFKETLLSILNGVILAGFLFLFIYFWQGEIDIALALSIALVAVVIFGVVIFTAMDDGAVAVVIATGVDIVVIADAVLVVGVTVIVAFVVLVFVHTYRNSIDKSYHIALVVLQIQGYFD